MSSQTAASSLSGESFHLRFRGESPQWRPWQRILGNTSAVPTGDANKQLSYTVTGLSNGVEYTFEVRAEHAATSTRGAASLRMSGTPNAAAASVRPAGLVAVADDRHVRLYLDKPEDAGDTMDYQIWQSPNYLGSTPSSDDWGVITFRTRSEDGDPTRFVGSVYSLNNDTTYTIRIRVDDDAPYAEVTVTPSTTAGEDPAVRPGFTLDATPNDGYVVLEWNKPDVDGVASYQYRNSTESTALAAAAWD